MGSPILAFYEGTGGDHRGRTLEEILAWSDAELETTHDYIQWLFPLREPSAFNPWAPVLTAADIAAFRSSPRLQERMRRAFRRMMQFYGFGGRTLPWLTAGNHNFLRLTRILTSLRLAGLEAEAQELFGHLKALYEAHPDVIGRLTWSYWQGAAQSPPVTQ